MLREIAINGGDPSQIKVTRQSNGARLSLDNKIMNSTLTAAGESSIICIDGLSAKISYVVDRDMVLIHAFGRTWRASIIDPAERELLAGNQSDIAKAPMPGVTIEVMVSVGDEVSSGQALLIIESMKMQMEIKASRDGTVEQINARVGESFASGAALVTLVAQETPGD